MLLHILCRNDNAYFAFDCCLPAVAAPAGLLVAVAPPAVPAGVAVAACFQLKLPLAAVPAAPFAAGAAVFVPAAVVVVAFVAAPVTDGVARVEAVVLAAAGALCLAATAPVALVAVVEAVPTAGAFPPCWP
jgi:hypothetical protein